MPSRPGHAGGGSPGLQRRQIPSWGSEGRGYRRAPARHSGPQGLDGRDPSGVRKEWNVSRWLAVSTRARDRHPTGPRRPKDGSGSAAAVVRVEPGPPKRDAPNHVWRLRCKKMNAGRGLSYCRNFGISQDSTVSSSSFSAASSPEVRSRSPNEPR